MERVTLCSCLKQVMKSLLFLSGCLERVGGVWHKQGFQLAEPRTDGAGKWGTSQKHWNPLQRPSPHFFLSSMHTLFFPPPLSLFSINEPFLCQDYLRALVIGHTSVMFLKSKTWKKEQKSKAAGRWGCLMSFSHSGNARCFGSSAGMSFCSPGWSQQMAGLGLGLFREMTAESQENILEALTACAPLIHHR